MLNFIKNVTIGIGGILGGVLAIIVLGVVFGGLWLILSALGLVSYAVLKVVGWVLIGAILTIAFAYLIGMLIRMSRE